MEREGGWCRGGACFCWRGGQTVSDGRTLASVAATAKDIAAAGGVAETAQVDALDERAVEQHIAAVAKKAGTIDISFNPLHPFRSRERREFPSPSCRTRASRLPSRRICDRIS